MDSTETLPCHNQVNNMNLFQELNFIQNDFFCYHCYLPTISYIDDVIHIAQVE